MQTRTLGPFEVSAIGMGAMPLSQGRNVVPDEADAVKTVHAALDAGVTLFDTADIYAPSWDQMGHNERLVAKAMKAYGGRPDGVVIATKGGITRSEGEEWGRDGSAGYLRSALEASMRALDVDVIDLYQWHRPDRWLVFGEVIGTFKALQDEGKVRAVGLSNVNVEEIEIAEQVLGPGGLASVQNQFSPSFTASADTLRHCHESGVAFLPWSPLGGTGARAAEIGQRFLVFTEIGDAHGVSPQQVVLAWELSLSPHVIPIPGASKARSILDSVKAVDLELSTDELDACAAACGLEKDDLPAR